MDRNMLIAALLCGLTGFAAAGQVATLRIDVEGTATAAVTVTGPQSKLVASALQPENTNNWETGSHAGLLTASGTNGLLNAAYLADWGATATVARATSATMLSSASGRAWTELHDGTNYTYWVTNSPNVYVVSMEGEGYNGPAAGTVLAYDGENWWGGHVLSYSDGVWQYEPGEGLAWTAGNPSMGRELPATLTSEFPEAAFGSFTLDVVPVTNVVVMATQDSAEAATVIIVSEHNASEALDTHPTHARTNDLFGLVGTNRVLTIGGVSYDLSADRSWAGAGASAPVWFRVPIGDWSTSAGARPTMTRLVSASGFGFAMASNATSAIYWQASSQQHVGATGVIVRATWGRTGAATGGVLAFRSTVQAYTNLIGGPLTSTVTLDPVPMVDGGVTYVTNLVAIVTGVWAGNFIRLSGASGDTADAATLVSLEYSPMMP